MNNLLKYRLGAMAVFAAALFIPHFIWEATVNENTAIVTIFGNPALADFWTWVQIWTTKAAYNLLHLFTNTIHLTDATTLYWDNGNTMYITPSCTALKQYWLQLLIIPCTALYTYFTIPAWLKKPSFAKGTYIAHTIGYMLLCITILLIFNILRICIATLAIQHSYEMYVIVHNQILRYVFYGIMFLSWVIWIEYLARKKTKQ